MDSPSPSPSSPSSVFTHPEVRLFIVRHGETVANISGIIQGHAGGALTNFGVTQCTSLGQRISSLQFHEAHVSDLRRTRQSAVLVFESSTVPKPPKIHLNPLLREKGCGKIEGLPRGTTEKMARQAKQSIRMYRPENGESWSDVNIRARTFLHRIISQHFKCEEDEAVFEIVQEAEEELASPIITGSEQLMPFASEVKNILVVTSGGWIKELWNVLFGVDTAPNNARNSSIWCLSLNRVSSSSSSSSSMPSDSKVQIKVLAKNDAKHIIPLRRTKNDEMEDPEHEWPLERFSVQCCAAVEEASSSSSS